MRHSKDPHRSGTWHYIYSLLLLLLLVENTTSPMGVFLCFFLSEFMGEKKSIAEKQTLAFISLHPAIPPYRDPLFSPGYYHEACRCGERHTYNSLEGTRIIR
jgi:hypothetical protein